jgi:MarR family multiple gene transcriptional regulator MgrA
MRLEDEIKTKAFRSERHKLAVNIIYTHNWLGSRSASLFQRYGVTGQQYNILRILRGQQPHATNLQLLKERMLDKQPDVSRLVDRLVAKDLVDRQTSTTDRRKLEIRISAAGLDLLARIEPELVAMEEQFTSLDDQEVAQLNALLDRMRDS